MPTYSGLKAEREDTPPTRRIGNPNFHNGTDKDIRYYADMLINAGFTVVVTKSIHPQIWCGKSLKEMLLGTDRLLPESLKHNRLLGREPTEAVPEISP